MFKLQRVHHRSTIFSSGWEADTSGLKTNESNSQYRDRSYCKQIRVLRSKKELPLMSKRGGERSYRGSSERDQPVFQLTNQLSVDIRLMSHG